jgi:hypothetical protein
MLKTNARSNKNLAKIKVSRLHRKSLSQSFKKKKTRFYKAYACLQELLRYDGGVLVSVRKVAVITVEGKSTYGASVGEMPK